MTEIAADGATRYAGARINRVEDARLLTGRGTFVDDITLPGMLHACFVRSPFAHAAIRGIDTSAARAVPGVRFVFTAADLNPSVKEQWHTSIGPTSPETPRPPLADDEVRFVGDPVALVLAVNRYVAEDAAELVDVDYEPLPAVVDYTTAEARRNARPREPRVQPHRRARRPSRVRARRRVRVRRPRGDARRSISRPTPRCRWRAVASSSTTPPPLPSSRSTRQRSRRTRCGCSARALLGIPEHRVRVVMRDTGGGFGQKILVQRDEMCLMLAAPKVGVPVKWVEDRRENLLAAGKSRQEHADVKMAFDEHGAIQGAYIDFVSDCGAYPTPWPVMTAAAVGALFSGPVPRTSRDVQDARRSTRTRSGRTAYRGPWQFESLAREVLLDIAARQMGIDPIELRRRNLLRRDELPYTNPIGMTYDSISPLETFEQALSMLDYEAFRREQTEARAAGRYLGVGTSNYVEPSTPGYGYYGTEAATIRVEPSGKVNVYIAGGSTGNSLETTVVQLTADALGVRIEDVNTIQGDTAVTGFGAGVAGSRSGSMTAGAVHATAAILVERIKAIAAHKLEAATEDIELAESRAHVRGTPSVGVSLEEIASTAYFERRPPAARRTGRSRSDGALRERRPVDLGERDACLHVRGRRRDRPRHAAALHRQRGLRSDDQPERGRRPDRRRHRAGHRWRPLRAPCVRRGRQPDHHDLHGLSDPHRGGSPDDRVRPRRDTESRPWRVQGRRRRRRDRRSTRGRQRRGRRARSVRRARHAAAVEPRPDRRRCSTVAHG